MNNINEDIKLIFDEDFYLNTNSDIKKADIDPLIHYLNVGWKEHRNPSRYFDNDFYIKNYGKYIYDGLSPLEHFVTVGWKRGFNPSEHFDVTWYLTHNSVEEDINPLIDYLYPFDSKKRFRRSVKLDLNSFETKEDFTNYSIIYDSLLFDEDWYLEQSPYVLGEINPILYYLNEGHDKRYNPNKNFDNLFYITTYPIVKKLKIAPLIHYILQGKSKNYKTTTDDFVNMDEQIALLSESELFDEEYYEEHYNIGDSTPIIHYLTEGYKKGYNPSKYFDTNWYLNKNTDVKNSNMNPLVHYITIGRKEDRLKRQASLFDERPNGKISEKIYNQYNKIFNSSLFDEEYYLNQIREEVDDPIYHYVTQGFKEDLDPHELFSNNKYRLWHSLIESTNPLYHYLTAGVRNNENTFASEKYLSSFDKNISFNDFVNVSRVLKDKKTFILPVSKISKSTIKSIESLIKNSYSNYELYIIDYSSKNEFSDYLDKLDNNVDIHIVKGTFASQFNKIITNSNNDVILLNTNLLYVAGWDTKLIKAIANCDYPLFTTKFTNGFEDDIVQLILQDLDINLLKLYEGIPEKITLQNKLFNDVAYIKKDFVEKLKNIKIAEEQSILDYLNSFNVDIGLVNNIILHNTDNISVLQESDNLSEINVHKILKNKFKHNLLFVTSTVHNIIDLGNNFSKLEDKYNVYVVTEDTDKIALWKHMPTGFSLLEEYPLKNTNMLDSTLTIYYNIISKYNCEVISVLDNSNYLIDNAGKNYHKIAQLISLGVNYSNTVTDEVINHIDNLIEHTSLYNKLERDYPQISFEDKKIAVYTIKQNMDDSLKVPEYVNDNVDYICFTNNTNLKQSVWDIRYVENLNSGDTYNEYKAYPNKYLDEYDYTLWVDDDLLIVSDIEDLIRKYYTNTGMLVINNDDDGYISVNNSKIIFRDNKNKNVFRNVETDTIQKDTINVVKLNPSFNQFFTTVNKSIPINFDLTVVNNVLNQLRSEVSILLYVDIDVTQNILKKCVDKVLKHTKNTYKLIILNDNNTNKQVCTYFDDLKTNDNIILINNSEYIGYANSINHAINLTKSDIILLNYKTMVTSKWSTKLITSAYSNNDIMTVTPFMNEGKISINLENSGYDNETISDIIEKSSENINLITPYTNTSCIYIKREAIYEIGFLNNNFDKDESILDFCIRLTNNSKLNVLDDSTYVYTESKKKPKSREKEFYEVHPNFNELKESLEKSFTFSKIKENIYNQVKITDKKPKERLLYLLHEGNGGTLYTSIELMSELKDDYDIYLLTGNYKNLKLWKYDENKNFISNNPNADDSFLENISTIANWRIKTTYNLKDESIDEYKIYYYNILSYFKIDLIHIRHMILNTFDFPNIANALNIPMILSFHDCFYICPSHLLIDDNGCYCGGHCTPITSYDTTEGQCQLMDYLYLPLVKTFINTWRKRVRTLLNQCELFITTSESTKKLYQEIYPQLKNKEFKIIEHGRDLKTPNNPKELINVPSKNEKIKILFPGHLNVHKGINLIESIKKEDKDNLLEYHFLGSIYPREKEYLGVYHGFYDRKDFDKKVKEIKPSFVGILSIWPETYCHTLTESWASGIPVLTINIGALGERVSKNGGGWFLSQNPKKAYEEIIKIAYDTENYLNNVDNIKNIKFKTVKRMAKEYKNEYLKILNNYKKDGDNL